LAVVLARRVFKRLASAVFVLGVTTVVGVVGKEEQELEEEDVEEYED
jgi:hypothetical protein